MMRKERTILLSFGVFGGLFAGLGLSFGCVFFMPVAIACLWQASRNLAAGFIWGLVAVLISHRWLLALHPLDWIGVPTMLSLPIAIAIWISCAVVAGCLVALWSYLSHIPIFKTSLSNGFADGILTAFALSCIWGLAETFLAQSPLFWIGIGGSVLPGDRPLAGLARLIGSGGLAAVQLIIGFWIWRLVFALKKGAPWKKIFLVGGVSLFLVHILGWNLLNAQGATNTANVALWQPNIPIREKFSVQNQIELPYKIDSSLKWAEANSASWLVAPEGVLNLNQELLAPSPIPFLSGGFRPEKGQQRSSLLIFDQGDKAFSQSIDKHRLVPVGEWMPNLFGFHLYGLSAVGGLYPGESSRLMRWSGPSFAVSICYELSDGNALAKAVNEGAEWIFVLANLDPYPELLQRQYLSLAQLRSIETGRDLITVANRGPSGLVQPSGDTIIKIVPFTEGINKVDLHLRSGITPYVDKRELPLVLLMMVSLFTLLCMRIFGVDGRSGYRKG